MRKQTLTVIQPITCQRDAADRGQLFSFYVERLERFVERLKLFVERLECFIERLDRFVERLELFVERLECFVESSPLLCVNSLK